MMTDCAFARAAETESDLDAGWATALEKVARTADSMVNVSLFVVKVMEQIKDGLHQCQ